MKMTHKAGDKLFVDFTGQKLYLVDKLIREISDVEVFVAIMGCSELTFVMAVSSQRKEDFILGCEKAVHFYGGVPQAIVPNNINLLLPKSVNTKHSSMKTLQHLQSIIILWLPD